jgi:hypothetical protein
MKKITGMFLLAVVLLNGVVYGSKKTTKPAREYIECRPLDSKPVKILAKARTSQLVLPTPILF